MAFDFDKWRAEYDSMTHEEHVAAYAELHKLYPVQRHFDVVACKQFLDIVRPSSVLEIGGWDGELASLVLEDDPRIRRWLNWEITREVVDNPACLDPRYEACASRAVSYFRDWDALVMSHVAEHMRWQELQGFLLSAPTIFIAAPLPRDGGDPNWHKYDGTHILEVGWNKITEWLKSEGYEEMPSPRTAEVRCFKRSAEDSNPRGL